MIRTLASMVAGCALSLGATVSRAEAQTAPADEPQPPTPLPDPVQPAPPEPHDGSLSDEELAKLADQEARSEVITVSGAPRGVAEDFLVLPDGADLGGRLRLITADDGLGVGRIKLTDLALFELDADWAFARSFELDGTISVLAKQPGPTSEPVFQGGTLTVRRDLFTRTALAVSGSAAPLLGLKGLALGAAAFVTHKHRLNSFVAFALAAGANATSLRPTTAEGRPDLLEGAGSAAIHAGFDRIFGGWMGASYAMPVLHRGNDPVSGMSLDPRPRLDINVGAAVRLADMWDLSVELSIIDRGDAADPATRLPILDGGFDQIQVSVGVSRRVDLAKRSRRAYGLGDPMIKL